MKRTEKFFVGLCVLACLAGACAPATYIGPVQIHILPGDHIKDAAIAVDSNGISHITGISGSHVVYYRTRFGEPMVRLTMTMSGSGTEWKQYNPDIAVLDNGIAYITWVEIRGSEGRVACWRGFSQEEPPEGYKTTCIALDSPNYTFGNVRVVARGNKAYAVYDRIRTDGRIHSLWYRELTEATNCGLVYDYWNYFESGYLYSMDLQIDSNGKLHVAFLDNYTYADPPYIDRLLYRSNNQVNLAGDMQQGWLIGTSLAEPEVGLSLAFFTEGSTDKVAIAYVVETDTPPLIDDIQIAYCDLNGCAAPTHDMHTVPLPVSWNSYSVITDVAISGWLGELILGFVGDDDPLISGHPQVYVKGAFETTDPENISGDSDAAKIDLELAEVPLRPDVILDSKIMFGWGETNLYTLQYYLNNGFGNTFQIYDEICDPDTIWDDIAANTYLVSGVWQSCDDTWFSTQAYVNDLPLIMK